MSSETLEQNSHLVTIKKSDADKQIVYGEVYVPYSIDTQGEMMLPDDIEKMAHRYLQLPNLSKTIDVNHDNRPVNCHVVESFVARKGDPEFTEGSWVVGMKIDDSSIWSLIKDGKINGFSFENIHYLILVA